MYDLFIYSVGTTVFHRIIYCIIFLWFDGPWKLWS